MIRYLKENDIKQLLTMPIALECVSRPSRTRAGARHRYPAREDAILAGIQHVLQAAAPELGLIGFNYYYTRPGAKSLRAPHQYRPRSSKRSSRPWMSMVRTGAASGVATRHLANDDAGIVGQIGAGFQAISQLERCAR